MTIKMPKELTAENGAKGLLSGEFWAEYTYFDSEDDERTVKVMIDWPTIKDIYAMAVKHLEIKK